MSRAQYRCAHDAQDLDDADGDEASLTLDACLRELYASHDELHPCLLSVAELAARLCPTAKAENGERSVRRAHGRLAYTYGPRFVEIDRTYGRTTLTVARWIEKPGGGGRSRFSSRDPIVDLRDLELRAKADARARTRAPRKRRSTEPKTPPPRQPARPHGITNPAILAPIATRPGVLEAVETAHGRHAAAAVLRELCRPRCHAHAAEAELAARTLGARATDTPLKLFRYLFRRAIDGDTLIERPDESARVRLAELELTLGPADVPPEERLAELEARLAAVRMGGDEERVLELEHAVGVLRAQVAPVVAPAPARRPAPARAPPKREPVAPAPVEPLERGDRQRGEAFLAALPPHLRAMFDGNS